MPMNLCVARSFPTSRAGLSQMAKNYGLSAEHLSRVIISYIGTHKFLRQERKVEYEDP